MRVLLVQRSLSPPGGGNAVAAWMLHALAAEHDVATLTARVWSAPNTNAFYGTSIPDTRIVKYLVPAPWKWLAALPEHHLTRLRMGSVLRYAQPLASRYDLLITADNYAAFAKPGIQYVHYPADLRPEPARMKPIIAVYLAICDGVLGRRWTDAAANLTLANSRWTAAGLERLGEVSKPIVLYPPVVDPGEGRPWSERDDTFLCIGRFHGSKRIETAMAIVSRVRVAAIPNARLVVVGSAVDREYTTRIRGLASRYGEWIEVREDLPRAELNGLMGRSRYGIQAMEHEHFGMATAEMTRAGCLVFAHDSGGSPEVLRHEEAVLWRTEDDAVQKVAAVSAYSRQLPPRLQSLRDHARQFSTEQFVEQFRDIVAGFSGAPVARTWRDGV